MCQSATCRLIHKVGHIKTVATASHYKEEFVLFTSQIQFPASLLDTPMKFNTGECNNTDAGMTAFSVLVGLKKKLFLLLSLLLLLKLELGW